MNMWILLDHGGSVIHKVVPIFWLRLNWVDISFPILSKFLRAKREHFLTGYLWIATRNPPLCGLPYTYFSLLFWFLFLRKSKWHKSIPCDQEKLRCHALLNCNITRWKKLVAFLQLRKGSCWPSLRPSKKKTPVDRPGFSKKRRTRAFLFLFICFFQRWPPCILTGHQFLSLKSAPTICLQVLKRLVRSLRNTQNFFFFFFN